jgi:hypothetical protein
VKVLLYLLLPVLVVAATAVGMWFRNRQPTSLESGVDAFRREMDALSPHAAPVQRRRPQPGAAPRGEPVVEPNRAEAPRSEAHRAEGPRAEAEPPRSGPPSGRAAPRRPGGGG